MKINTPYLEDSIRLIQDMESIRIIPWKLLQQWSYSKKSPIRRIQYMDTPKVFNWKTATYGKIKVDDDLHSLSSIEAEFPAIVINDAVAPQDELQCKSQVSTPVNDEIDFRISFDESDDEDYTILFDKKVFSYKMIFVNDLKTDSKNDYEKVMPSIPSLEHVISCFDDLDFFTHFENEFLAIVYNDAQTSKSDLLTEPILNPQHIDEFDLNDKTSLSEYDEEEQNILYFNDLFPFNIIRPDMALPPREQRHIFLRYEELEYTDADIADFKARLARIHRREVHRVSVFNFRGLSDLMAEGLSGRMLMEHRDEAGAILDLDTPGTLQFQLGGARRHMSWRQFILALGLHTEEEMQTARFDFLGTTPSYTLIRDPILRLCHRLIACSIAGRSQAPEKVTVTHLFYLRGMDVDSVNVPYLLARYLRLFTAGRKSGVHIFGGQFVTRLAEHFELLIAEILGRLTFDDTWAWVAMGPERQPVATAGAPAVAEDALIIDEGGQADPATEQAPQQPPPPPPAHSRTMPQRIARLEEDVQYMGYHWLKTDDGQGRSCLYAICSDPCIILEAHQTEDWQGQHLRCIAGPTAA
ncbi:hypothetical protein Tco_0655377 [Tanacetum coccineum]|uniref:Uncharacterized protein n=1 Tax=Tanacetum coccineum TaxID=301880 RepID=A0ABQ4X6C6_9ASTR